MRFLDHQKLIHFIYRNLSCISCWQMSRPYHQKPMEAILSLVHILLNQQVKPVPVRVQPVEALDGFVQSASVYQVPDVLVRIIYHRQRMLGEHGFVPLVKQCRHFSRRMFNYRSVSSFHTATTGSSPCTR